MVDRSKEYLYSRSLAPSTPSSPSTWRPLQSSELHYGSLPYTSNSMDHYMHQLHQFNSNLAHLTGGVHEGGKGYGASSSDLPLYPLNHFTPSPAHSPIPHSTMRPVHNPLPAHMRSNPYQPTSNYHLMTTGNYSNYKPQLHHPQSNFVQQHPLQHSQSIVHHHQQHQQQQIPSQMMYTPQHPPQHHHPQHSHPSISQHPHPSISQHPQHSHSSSQNPLYTKPELEHVSNGVLGAKDLSDKNKKYSSSSTPSSSSFKESKSQTEYELASQLLHRFGNTLSSQCSSGTNNNNNNSGLPMNLAPYSLPSSSSKYNNNNNNTSTTTTTHSGNFEEKCRILHNNTVRGQESVNHLSYPSPSFPSNDSLTNHSIKIHSVIPSTYSYNSGSLTITPSLPSSSSVKTSNLTSLTEACGKSSSGGKSWKRKGLQLSRVESSVKRLKGDGPEPLDPYTFQDDELESKASLSKPSSVYKFKNAMLTRETSSDVDHERDKRLTEEKERNVKETESSVPVPLSNSSVLGLTSEENDKRVKGYGWALPKLPKLPSKVLLGPSFEPVNKSTPPPSSLGSVTDVWLHAFGAAKIKKNTNSSSSPLSKDEVNKRDVSTLSLLDIPSELRRRNRPSFGGLIHFAPDWEKAVRAHHEKCRIPSAIYSSMNVQPLILSRSSKNNSVSTSCSSSSSSLTTPICGIPSLPPIETKIPSTGSLAEFKSFSKWEVGVDSLSPITSVVDSILENRKRLRNTMGRMFKVPFMKEKKKGGGVNASLFSHSGYSPHLPFCKSNLQNGLGLLHTPGLSLLFEDSNSSQYILGGSSNLGNFRRQTLLRYLDSMDTNQELKARVLDWKPQVFESKTRRQSHQIKVVTSYREIFGIDLPAKYEKRKKNKGNVRKRKSKVKKEEEEEDEQEKEEKKSIGIDKPALNFVSNSSLKGKNESVLEERKQNKAFKEKRKSRKALRVEVEIEKKELMTSKQKNNNEFPHHSTSSTATAKTTTATTNSKDVDDDDVNEKEEEEENYVPSPSEDELQSELQNFALLLLNENPSWSKKIVIQNLVIWEPVESSSGIVSLSSSVSEKRGIRKNGKKYKRRKSGMDLIKGNRGRPPKSREPSRPSTPDSSAHSVFDVLYTLDQTIKESSSWVIDKRSGETILHRASKMGYPDVAVYALDMVKISPSVKDNAGIPPIHKAAFKGNGDIVLFLLKYGADPNTNVKGTRPLHEALEGGDLWAVYHLLTYGSDPLLYDYSGNMPIDLTENDERMKRYLTALLSDLHGKTAERYNVSHDSHYIVPPPMLDEDEDSEKDRVFEFELSSQALPPYYQFNDEEGHWVKKSDIPLSKKGAASESLLCKLTVLEVSKDEFYSKSHCCLLGGGNSFYHQSLKEKSIFYKVDDILKKILGVSESFAAS